MPPWFYNFYFPSVILQHLHRDASGRYPAFDIFRGMAIFTMLAANSAAGSLVPPHHFLFRVYGSFAAPVFIFLSGFMVAGGHERHSLAYFFLRGGLILLISALIDLFIWQIVPFTTFDVLYLIGLGVPVAALTMKLKLPWRIFLCLLFFAMGPILQNVFRYDVEVHEFALKNFSFAQLQKGETWWWKSWLTEGWFPVFPWMGFVLAGTLVYTHGAQITARVKLFLPLGVLLFISGVMWLYFHPPIAEREQYSELFYPPGMAYLLAASGSILAGISLLPFFRWKYGLQLFGLLGSCSLFIYILHSALIRYVLDIAFKPQPLKFFLLIYLALVAVNIFFAWLLHVLKMKTDWKKMPGIVKMILGG